MKVNALVVFFGVVIVFSLLVVSMGSFVGMGSNKIAQQKMIEISQRVLPSLEQALESRDFALGNKVFLRILKEELLLELWVQQGNSYKLYKEYPILAMSGTLGPKTKEGDKQAPEGIYSTDLRSLNPNSRYHLSFNINYPNQHDIKLGRTGSFIMVHGSNKSIGCFAIGNEAIEEVYLIVEAALMQNGGIVPIYIFPFAMTDNSLEYYKNDDNYPFWRTLLPVWECIENENQPYNANK